MTPTDTAALVAQLRAAYREALVIQDARDAADTLHREVYRLQQVLMAASLTES